MVMVLVDWPLVMVVVIGLAIVCVAVTVAVEVQLDWVMVTAAGQVIIVVGPVVVVPGAVAFVEAVIHEHSEIILEGLFWQALKAFGGGDTVLDGAR
jgi:hypothetical protein